jgi:hypothetical protein
VFIAKKYFNILLARQASKGCSILSPSKPRTENLEGFAF